MKSTMIRIGNFFFRYRNRLFPLLIVALYALAVPPSRLFGSDALEDVKDFIGIAIALSGLAFRGFVIGFAYIKRGGLNKQVYADKLVTSGIFGISRNPLYVGNLLIYMGVFLVHGNPLVMIPGMALFLFIYWCIVFAEEAYLEEKFGADYRAYCTQVPRWLPDWSHYKAATKDMEFNFRRALIKDYSTIATTIVTLTLTEMYEDLSLPDIAPEIPELKILAAILIATGVLALTVRILKKRKLLTDGAV